MQVLGVDALGARLRVAVLGHCLVTVESEFRITSLLEQAFTKPT